MNKLLVSTAFILLSSTGFSNARQHPANFHGYKLGHYRIAHCNLVPHPVRSDPFWYGCTKKPTFKERWPVVKFADRWPTTTPWPVPNAYEIKQKATYHRTLMAKENHAKSIRGLLSSLMAYMVILGVLGGLISTLAG